MGREMAMGYTPIQIVVYGKVNGKKVLSLMGKALYVILIVPSMLVNLIAVRWRGKER